MPSILSRCLAVSLSSVLVFCAATAQALEPAKGKVILDHQRQGGCEKYA